MDFLSYLVSFWAFPLKVIFWIAIIFLPIPIIGFVLDECDAHNRKKTEPNGIVRNAPLILGYVFIHYVVLIIIGLPWLFYSFKVS